MVASIEFPSNSKVKVLAIDEVNQPPQVNLGNAADAQSPDERVSRSRSITRRATMVAPGSTVPATPILSMHSRAVTGSASVVDLELRGFQPRADRHARRGCRGGPDDHAAGGILHKHPDAGYRDRRDARIRDVHGELPRGRNGQLPPEPSATGGTGITGRGNDGVRASRSP